MSVLRSTVRVRRSCWASFQASACDIFPGPPLCGGGEVCRGGFGLRSGFCGEARLQALSPGEAELTGVGRFAGCPSALDAGSRSPFRGEAADSPGASLLRRELCGDGRLSFPHSAIGAWLTGRRGGFFREVLRATFPESCFQPLSPITPRRQSIRKNAEQGRCSEHEPLRFAAKRGSRSDRLSHGLCCHLRPRHSPRLRLAPPVSKARLPGPRR